MSPLTPTDETYLRMAIELSRRAPEDQGKTPFGAILVLDDEVVSEGTSRQRALLQQRTVPHVFDGVLLGSCVTPRVRCD